VSPVRLVRGFNCPACGSGIELHAGAHTRNVACAHCGAVLDAIDPNLRILQQVEQRLHLTPAIPLGTRGTLDGVEWEAVGFQQRTITVEGEDFSWREYLLFNPYRGYRYLTEYDGHWNDVQTLRAVPQLHEGARPVARYGGTEFKHFQTATARTTYVIGEFPWEVRVGDEVMSRDFVAPPRLLSQEVTDDETTWSLGTYTTGEAIARAFRLEGRPRPAIGIFANQPNPYHARARAVWRMAKLCLLALAVLGAARCATARNEEVFARRYEYRGAQGDTAAFVTSPFTLGGRTSNVEVELWADVDNSYLMFDLSLVNAATGDVRDVGREVAEYSGVEDGESWREGSQKEVVLLPRVPAGEYYLRLRPEGAGPPVDAPFGGAARPINYTVRVRRDVPRPGYWLIAFGLILFPPLWPVLRSWSFEQSRWAESDHAPTHGSSDDEDDDE
jgi:hypothetical protein